MSSSCTKSMGRYTDPAPRRGTTEGTLGNLERPQTLKGWARKIGTVDGAPLIAKLVGITSCNFALVHGDETTVR
jgi:hypothetical protein